MVKKVCVVILMFCAMGIMMMPVFAANTQTKTTSELFEPPDNHTNNSNNAEESITKFSKELVGTVMTIVNIVVVVGTVLLGISYMVNGVEGKAKIKEKMLPFVIGVVLVTCGLNVINLISGIGSNLFGK